MSIKKNFLYQSIYQILMVASPLITSPYLARVLGAEKIGVYSYCYSIAYYFSIFAVLGLGSYGNRAISRKVSRGKEEVSKTFWSIFSMQLMCSFIVVIVYLGYVFLLAGEYRVNALIEMMYVISICIDISWLYFGLEEFRTTTIRSSFVKILTIVLILGCVKSPQDLNIYTAIMAGGNLLANLVLWVPLKRYICRVKVTFLDVIPHFKPNLMLFVPVVSLGVFHYMDKFMVGKLSTMEELGYYANADKVINIPLGLITALSTVMMPRISKLAEKGENRSAFEYTENSLIFSLWMGAAMCFGIMAVAREFVPVFFGDGYQTCITLLFVFSPVLLIKAWSGPLKLQVLIPFGMDKQLNLSVIAAAVVNVIANLLLIPKFGSTGAVTGTLLAELCVLGFYLLWSAKKVRFIYLLKWLMVFIVAGFVMYLIVRIAVGFFDSFYIKLGIGILTGIVAYCLFSVLILNIMKWKPYVEMQNRFLHKKRQ